MRHASRAIDKLIPAQPCVYAEHHTEPVGTHACPGARYLSDHAKVETLYSFPNQDHLDSCIRYKKYLKMQKMQIYRVTCNPARPSSTAAMPS